MGGQAGQSRDGVVDLGAAGLGHDRPDVAQLSAALSVEGRAVHEDLGRARFRTGQDSQDLGRRRRSSRTLADKGGRTRLLEHGAVGLLVGRPAGARAAWRARLRCSAMAASKAATIDRQARFARQLFGQLDGEAVGVVQFEGDVAVQDRTVPLVALGEFTFEQRQPGFEGCGRSRPLRGSPPTR